MVALRSFLAGLALALTSATSAAAVECERMEHQGNRYTVCTVSPDTESLRLFLNDNDGNPLGSFENVQLKLRGLGRQLVFAMNAGMYHEDRSPVGHYLENGDQEMRVLSGASPGNFGLLPNGILCLRSGRADVIETRAYLARKPGCQHATQSGPMLVIDGDMHPRFLKTSTSRYIRNGVGTADKGTRAVFVISDNAVTFYEFAELFRDKLKTPNALFLDGNVSRLYAPQLGRSDTGRRMGPIVGVSVPATN
ncbi:phosphodiester glycosidase family protein [uncultured Pelagimonas sp.]|uniref:phosphodiester glycosidase family protein n=1 Tax=uncultured Pelagimonas sp. TaxID=1618102 RepID=UPI002619EBDE|nr:phosphodiester glycosidase family protein [uncultured Pelagimonas sp.]